MKRMITIGVLSFAVCVGHAVGGVPGSILCGVLACSLTLFYEDDSIWGKSLRAYWLLKRGTLLTYLLGLIGGVLAQSMLESFWATAGVTCVSMLGGHWLIDRWGWSDTRIHLETGVRTACLAIVYSAGNLSQAMDADQEEELRKAARLIYSELGYRHPRDIASFLEEARETVSKVELPDMLSFLRGLPELWKRSLVLDVLKIVYARPAPLPEQVEYARFLYAQSGIEDFTTLRFYERPLPVSADQRAEWLKELELPPDAADTQVKAAYKEMAKKYHPDRMHQLPAGLVALAEAKMKSVNLAYDNLVKKSARRPQYTFLSAGSHLRHSAANHPEFWCECWLCGTCQQVASTARLEEFRCGSCYALLGIAES